MDRYIDPTPVGPRGRLAAEQVDTWRQQGYAFVRGLIPNSLVSSLAEAAVEAFPAPESEESETFKGFGSRGQFVFPSETMVFNEITLHQNLLQAVADLLDLPVTELRLSQSDLWPKYGNGGDQRIHVDYPNHTIAHPTPWSRPEAVEMILYLSDWSVTGGSTAVIPRRGEDDPAYRWPIVDSPGIGELQYVNDRAPAEAYFAEQRPALADWRKDLYQRERYTRFAPGDVIFYRHDTWHRGTPMKPGTLRLAHNMTFRRASAEWISTLHTGWAWQSYRPSKLMPRLLSNCTLEQRAVLGFPQPGDDYWCEETLQAIEARYGMYGFDVSPYRAALGA